MRQLITVGVALSIAAPAAAQRVTIRGALSGRAFPLTMKLKQLTGRWRRVTVSGAASADGNVNVIVHGGEGSLSNNQNNIAGLGGVAGGVYYTAGQTVMIGSNTYLVAYARPIRGLVETLLLAATAGKPPVPERLTPDTALALSLLDLRTLGSLNDIRAFDLKREIAESQKSQAAAEQALKAAGGRGGGR